MTLEYAYAPGGIDMKNPLAELAKTGQSIWFDQMERKLITTLLDKNATPEQIKAASDKLGL